MCIIKKKKKRQIIISTHSYDLLSDKGIDGNEVLMLKPDVEGTQVKLASSIKEVQDLLESGFSVAESVIPGTEPQNIIQVSFFNE